MRVRALRGLQDLSERMGFVMRDPSLWEQALTHASVLGHADAAVSYERLEFLGDAVLDATLAWLLMQRFPDKDEGELSILRASLVGEGTLREIARAHNVPLALRYEGVFAEDTLLRIAADALEAMVAALFLDQGFDAVQAWVTQLWEPWIQAVFVYPKGGLDAKSQLQILAQRAYQCCPYYETVSIAGEAHTPWFEVEARVQGFHARGSGKNRKQAEQHAATSLLQTLQVREHESSNFKEIRENEL